MKGNKTELFLQAFCIAILCWAHIAYALDCPNKVYAELKKDVVIIDCRISQTGDVYWYKGNTTKTSPLARVENGRKQVFKGNGHYDVSRNGSLIIMNVEEQHYGVYSILHFSTNDKYETSQVELDKAVHPPVLCPIIMGCGNCSDNCILRGDKAGNLTCSISRTSPPVDLRIWIDIENGFSVHRNTSEKRFDAETNTWNTTLTVRYGWSVCGSSLRIGCVAENLHAFELSNSYATLKSAPCTTTIEDSPISSEKNEKATLLWISIITTIVLIAIGVTFAIYKKKVSPGSRKKEVVSEDDEKCLFLDSDEGKGILSRLTAHLKKEYAKLGAFHSPLSGSVLSSQAIFKGISFNLTDMNDEETIISSEDLVPRLFKKAQRFVFVDDKDFSRRLFMQYVCSGVSQVIPHQDVLTFYVTLGGLHGKMTIADAIVQKMNLEGNFSVSEIQKTVNSFKCLIILDEIDKLIPQETTQDTEYTKSSEITIEDLLKGSNLFNTFHNVHCLVLFRSFNYLPPSYTKPHSCLTLRRVNPSNLTMYVRSIAQYYSLKDIDNRYPEWPKADCDTGKRDNAKVNSNDKEKEDKAARMTINILEKGKTTTEFIKDQIWLTLFIHTIILGITKCAEVEDTDLRFYRRTWLVKMILNYLEHQYSFNPLGTSNFGDLMRMLGCASLETDLKNPQFDKKSSLLVTYERNELERIVGSNIFLAALSCGLIAFKEIDKPSNEVDSDEMFSSLSSNVAFCHKYVQEYLAAQVIASHAAALNTFLKSSCWEEDDRMERVLQFIFVNKTGERNGWLTYFVREKKWDIFVDWLFDSENTDDYLKLLKLTFPPDCGQKISFGKLTCNFHRLAIGKFCKNLVKINVQLSQLTFSGKFPVDFLSQLYIPKVRFLVIQEMNFQNGNDFIIFLELVLRMNMIDSVILMKCNCPDALCKQDFHQLTSGKSQSKRPEILNMDTIEDISTEYFSQSGKGWRKLNFENASWD